MLSQFLVKNLKQSKTQNTARSRSNPLAVTSPSDFAPASSKELLDIQATIEC